MIGASTQALPIAQHPTAGQQADRSHHDAVMEAGDGGPAIILADKG
ncbi:MAG: hypothetical protein NZM27_01025 [Acetobacteraceae bacterium]|nr:hypothetical protein [Acetobacteraceae bacterium]